MKSIEDVVDLTAKEQADSQQYQLRLDELAQIDEEIGALETRRDALTSELGLKKSISTASAQKAFLDEDFDAFAGSPTKGKIQSLDVEDEEFEERFATFAANDEKGDHKARRWFDSA